MSKKSLIKNGIALLVLLTLPFFHRWVIVKADFPDVPNSHIYAEAIAYVESEGIVNGYPDGTYKPDNTINRAEFTKIIINSQFESTVIDSCIANNAEADWTFLYFPDVSLTEWFSKYICVAKTEGIVSGYPDGTYQPANEISVVEAAKIIVNAFGYNVGTDPIWYKPYILELESRNALPTTFVSFEQKISRGEMAEMIYRLLENITDKPTTSYNELAGIAEEPEPTVDTVTFDMTAQKFFFTPSTITVNQGDHVILNITSIEGTHGFAISEYGITETLPQGETVTIEFDADQVGSFGFECSIFCGSGHSGMDGTLTVE